MTTTETAPEPAATPAPSAERRPHRFDPFEKIEDLQEELAPFGDQTWPFSAHRLMRLRRRLALALAAWMPMTDMYEQDGKLVVKAELPGLQKEDIDITLDQGNLVIRGERELKEDVYYRRERSYGRFYRRIPLGFDVRPDQLLGWGARGAGAPAPAEAIQDPRDPAGLSAHRHRVVRLRRKLSWSQPQPEVMPPSTRTCCASSSGIRAARRPRSVWKSTRTWPRSAGP